jgi:hypothetical protein
MPMPRIFLRDMQPPKQLQGLETRHPPTVSARCTPAWMCVGRATFSVLHVCLHLYCPLAALRRPHFPFVWCPPAGWSRPAVQIRRILTSSLLPEKELTFHTHPATIRIRNYSPLGVRRLAAAFPPARHGLGHPIERSLAPYQVVVSGIMLAPSLLECALCAYKIARNCTFQSTYRNPNSF